MTKKSDPNVSSGMSGYVRAKAPEPVPAETGYVSDRPTEGPPCSYCGAVMVCLSCGQNQPAESGGQPLAEMIARKIRTQYMAMDGLTAELASVKIIEQYQSDLEAEIKRLNNIAEGYRQDLMTFHSRIERGELLEAATQSEPPKKGK